MDEFTFGGIPTSLPINFLGDHGSNSGFDHYVPPMIGGQPLSPVHFSGNGVHADLGIGSEKIHVPFIGQTTLQTFGVGDGPSLANDVNLANLGGTLQGW